MAVCRSETSITHPAPVRSRRNSAAATPKAMFMAPMLSPMAGRCRRAVVAPSGARTCRHAAPGPVGAPVVAGSVAVGPVEAEAVPPGVDDPGVARPHLGVGQTERLDRLGQEVGQEDVGGLDQPEHELAPVGMLQVHADAALAPVGVGELRFTSDSA